MRRSRDSYEWGQAGLRGSIWWRWAPRTIFSGPCYAKTPLFGDDMCSFRPYQGTR